MTDKESPTAVTVNVNLPTHPSPPPSPVPELKSTGSAYLIWAFAGGLGAHRFYLGRPHGVTMLMLALGGLITVPFMIGLVPLMILGIWVLVDAVAIPRWVEESRAAALAPAAAPVMQTRQTAPAAPQTPALPPPLAAAAGTGGLRIELLRAAVERGGVLTVTEGVIATGKTFKEVEACLNRMVDSGYVDIGNRPGSGWSPTSSRSCANRGRLGRPTPYQPVDRIPPAFDRRCIRAGRFASPVHSVKYTLHYVMPTIHSATPGLRSALLLSPVALLLALRRALPARRLAALGSRAALSTDCYPPGTATTSSASGRSPSG